MPDDANPLPPEPPPDGVRTGPPLPAPAASPHVRPGDPPRPVEVVLRPASSPRGHAQTAKAGDKTKPPEPKDSFREVVETVVFVVVLVLLLKTFLAEAFVIPTGSMATTLLGYHREVTCQQCGHKYLVNASKEADPTERQRQVVVSCTCPNCYFENPVGQPVPPPPGGGNR
jgi:signal peptidase I